MANVLNVRQPKFGFLSPGKKIKLQKRILWWVFEKKRNENSFKDKPCLALRTDSFFKEVCQLAK
jgi:hypothetical protein